jgi:predicted nucleic acid-binding protein
MAQTARYLIDTSAQARIRHDHVRRQVEGAVDAGLAATSAPLDSEALYSARSPADYEEIRRRRRYAYEYLPTDDEHWQRALDAQRELARSGRHRAVGITDLLVSVLAAEHRLTVLHYDADFETAAEAIGFAHKWVAPPGSL